MDAVVVGVVRGQAIADVAPEVDDGPPLASFAEGKVAWFGSAGERIDSPRKIDLPRGKGLLQQTAQPRNHGAPRQKQGSGWSGGGLVSPSKLGGRQIDGRLGRKLVAVMAVSPPRRSYGCLRGPL